MTSVHHPPGCRCPGCLPGQYVMRPAPSHRAVPQIRQGPGPVAWRLRLWGGLAALGGLFAVFMIPYWLWWHTTNSAGGIEPSDATWFGYSAVILVLALVVKLGMVMHARKQPSPPERVPMPLSVAKCAARGHPGAVPVDNDDLGRLAWWCPSCETQLDADWKPAPLAPAPAPGTGWTWRWWCTCGKRGQGWSASEAGAKSSASAGVMPHQGAGHSWQNEWRAQ